MQLLIYVTNIIIEYKAFGVLFCLHIVCSRVLLLTIGQDTRVRAWTVNYICKRLRLRVLTVCNWRIKISHKCHTFICHVKIYALSAFYANLINLIHASKQNACKQAHRQFAAVTRDVCCNLKMLSRCYLIYLTKTFGSINKIFGRVKKTIQAKTLVDSSKRVSLTKQKFELTKISKCSVKSTKYRQPNYSVRRTIFFLSVCPSRWTDYTWC